MTIKKYQYKIFKKEDLENKYTSFGKLPADKEGFIEADGMDEAVDEIVDINSKTYEDEDLIDMFEYDEDIYIAIKEDGESRHRLYKAYVEQHVEYIWSNREMAG